MNRYVVSGELFDRLQLIRSSNIGPVSYYRLLQKFGSAKRALEGLPDLARRGRRQPPEIASADSVVQTFFQSAVSDIVDVAHSKHMSGIVSLRILTQVFLSQAPCPLRKLQSAEGGQFSFVHATLQPDKLAEAVPRQQIRQTLVSQAERALPQSQRALGELELRSHLNQISP